MTFSIPMSPAKPDHGTGKLFAELNHLCSSCNTPKGTVLFRTGDSVADVLLVRAGAISLWWVLGADLVKLDTIGPGGIVGLPAALNGTHSVTALVIEDAEIGRIPAPRVRELIEWTPDLALAAVRLISQELWHLRVVVENTVLPEGQP